MAWSTKSRFKLMIATDDGLKHGLVIDKDVKEGNFVTLSEIKKAIAADPSLVAVGLDKKNVLFEVSVLNCFCQFSDSLSTG